MAQEPKVPGDGPLAERLAALRGTKAQHLSLLGEILAADDGKLFPVDLVVIGVTHRSIALIDGFAALVEQRNALAAIPLVRIQIDSVIRLYACWLVTDQMEVAAALLKDQPLSQIRSHDGSPLTDKYLYTQAAEHYPWIPEVYRQTSGFVHLSCRHLTAPVTAAKDDAHLEGIIGATTGWKDADMLEAVAAFTEATRSLLHLAWSWLKTKQLGAMPPAERAKRMGVPLPERFSKPDAPPVKKQKRKG